MRALEEVLRIVEESQFSRYPVYEESIDNIIGLVLTKDLLQAADPAALRTTARRLPPRSACASCIRPGSCDSRVARSRRCPRRLQASSRSTWRSCSTNTAEPRASSRWRICSRRSSARFSTNTTRPKTTPSRCSRAPAKPSSRAARNIGELNEQFGLDVPDEDATTIGGFVFGILGRLPQTAIA